MIIRDNLGIALTALMGTVIGTAAVIGPAFGQPQEQTARRQAVIEQITVTAQKREESIQSVPIAVTAITGGMIERSHSVTLEGLQGSVPNVQIGHFSNTPHTAVFNIRGMGVIEPDPYAGTTVSVVVDGVPQYFSMVSLLDLFDIERIEILRGPQGTLFGANTTGGVVNVVTKQPTGEFGGEAMVTLGNYNRLDANVALNFPIVEDVLAGKLSVLHHGRDGWHTNVVDGTDLGSRNTTAVRGYLRYMGGDSFDATLIAEYVRGRDGSPIVVDGAVPGEVHYFEPGTGPATGGGVMYPSPCVPAGQPCNAPDDYLAAHHGVPDMMDMNTYALTLNMTWDTSLGEITSITGYKEFDLNEFTDQDGTPFFNDDTERMTTGWQFSQELRNRFQINDNVEVLVGGFLMVDHYNHAQDFRIQFAAPGLRQLTVQDQDNWSASAFVQTFINLTEDLRFQAGIRYTHEDTEMTVNVDNFIHPSGVAQWTGDDFIGGFMSTGSETWDNVGGKLGLDWQVSDNILAYGYYARGFKSGGFVGRIVVPQDIGPYDPEYVNSVEVGVKSDWLGQRLRVNLALFQNWYKDMQLAQIYFTEDPFGNLVNGNSILNAASAEIRGFELEVTGVPVAGLTLTGALAYLDATYNNFDYLDPASTPDNPIIRDLSGFRLQNAPKWTANAGFTYSFPTGPGETTIGAQYKYVSAKYNTSLVNSPRSRIQPTHIVDAHLDWMPDSERWSIGIWGRNLFDNRYIASVFDAPGVFGLVSYAAPREYGASFKYFW